MEIVPHVRIGRVRLGMSQEEAEWLRESGMQTDCRGAPPVVAFIQVSRRVCATYRDVDVFEDPATEVVAEIVRLEGLNPADYPPGRHQYLFPALNFALWRGYVNDDNPDDHQGYHFQAASIHAPGYDTESGAQSA
ncbi:hypothetical protein R5W23_002668 [Gemmata sp. JC673]|uniref:Uncharacterized protein n=1 Tax=Gemmata algarum TaxID=2975278 RepID=A0ABU5F3U9_9BACT|nr:hypothetical protein [Gemmata algarum]MDY3561390.1 hypothetical protein [Gemmata algarum]